MEEWQIQEVDEAAQTINMKMVTVIDAMNLKFKGDAREVLGELRELRELFQVFETLEMVRREV